jgi:hypothetical protein
MREELQKEIDELGLGEAERALYEAELNRGDYDAVIHRIARAQHSEVPGVTKGTQAKCRAICSEEMRLKGEDGVRRYLDATRSAADHGHPTLHALLDLMEREFLSNSRKT